MTSVYDQSIYSESPLLPELFHYIATMSPLAWAQIAQSCSDFGRWSLTDAGRREFARLFIQLHRVNHHGVHFVALTCDGMCRSVYDWPAIIRTRSEEDARDIELSDFINGGPPVLTQRWILSVEYDNIRDELLYNQNIHRTSSPAMICCDGTRMWYRRGKLHREDGPAIERIGGRNEWWLNGGRHRVDGPAVICIGRREWWLNGDLHREDGPAIVYDSGTEEWYQHNRRHRRGGPALVRYDGLQEWWENGVLIRSSI